MRFSAARIAWCAHCHCTMCRKAHGAAFVTWAGIKRVDFKLLSGEAELRTYRSSQTAVRRFCGRCGTMLFFEGERWPDEVHVARAMLEGDVPPPAAHVFWDDRVPWVELHDGLPRRGGPTGTAPLT
jgi:hypothetical protein